MMALVTIFLVQYVSHLLKLTGVLSTLRSKHRSMVETPKSNLTVYQQRINDAAAELCLHNHNLLSDCKLLLETREKVHKAGYSYKGIILLEDTKPWW